MIVKTVKACFCKVRSYGKKTFGFNNNWLKYYNKYIKTNKIKYYESR